MIKKILAAGLALWLLSTASYGDVLDHFDERYYRAGDEGVDLIAIDFALARQGLLAFDRVDGVFGPDTAEALRTFQDQEGLDVDGIAGPGTLTRMAQSRLFPVVGIDAYKESMTSDTVGILQDVLRTLGYFDHETTTYYGAITRDAVLRFQSDQGLTADGVIGEETLFALENLGYLILDEGTPAQTAVPGRVENRLYRPGMVHPDVAILQRALAAAGYFDGEVFTTDYGPQTEEAVRAFQRAEGLEDDGILGETTLNRLVARQLVERKAEFVSRARVGTESYGEYLSWNDARRLFERGKSVITLKDLDTGVTFDMLVSYGSNHADVEPLTREDTEAIRRAFGGFNWARRPMLVYFGDRVIAASLAGMPHAGLDAEPEGAYIANRSDGFGYGYNYDRVKNNGVDGHFCLHFRDSRLHANNAVDPKHQAAIERAAGR